MLLYFFKPNSMTQRWRLLCHEIAAPAVYSRLVIAIANVPPFREKKKIKKLEGNANSQFHFIKSAQL